MSWDWDKLRPRSAFLFESSLCPESFFGILHSLTDLRQPMPKRARCKGQMVISWIFAGVWKQALRAKISSTSVSQPLNFSNFLWLSILLLHETRGTISHDRFLDLASGPHSPPTKSAKVQAIFSFENTFSKIQELFVLLTQRDLPFGNMKANWQLKRCSFQYVI